MDRDKTIEYSPKESTEKGDIHDECCILLKKGEEVELGTCELSTGEKEKNDYTTIVGFEISSIIIK